MEPALALANLAPGVVDRRPDRPRQPGCVPRSLATGQPPRGLGPAGVRWSVRRSHCRTGSASSPHASRRSSTNSRRGCPHCHRPCADPLAGARTSSPRGWQWGLSDSLQPSFRPSTHPWEPSFASRPRSRACRTRARQSALHRTVGVADLLVGSPLWWLVLASRFAGVPGRIAISWLRFVDPLAGIAVAPIGVASFGSLWFRTLAG
jgi:hypothetical protein